MGTPDCADCGHPWADHRVVWVPAMSFNGPCTFPSKPSSWEFDASKGKPPCECKAYKCGCGCNDKEAASSRKRKIVKEGN